MKIALCISGHLRKFEQTFSSLNEFFIKRYNVDIFIHTWDKLGFNCQYKSDLTLDSTTSKSAHINNLYNPKKIIIESSSFIEHLKNEANSYAPHLKYCPKHPGHMASMFYKIYACNELRKKYELETGINYDLVVRCRSDLMIQNYIRLPNKYVANKVWIPKSISSQGWYTDQFAIGGPNEMDLYSSAYFDLPEYFLNKNEYYPEKFLAWSFAKKDLSIIPHDINFFILR